MGGGGQEVHNGGAQSGQAGGALRAPGGGGEAQQVAFDGQGSRGGSLKDGCGLAGWWSAR